MGLRPGCVLDFSTESGILKARKRTETDPFRKWRGRGKIPDKVGVDQYLKKIRDAHSC